MPIDTPVSDLVRQLSRVGLRPDERLVKRIVEYGPEARPALLELARDTEALHSDMPAALGPLHALRLLGEVPDVSMIAPVLSLLPIQVYGDQDVPSRLFATEVLQIVGRVGAPAVPALWAYADDEANSPGSRAAAANSLAFVSTFAPETRDEILAEARRRLESAETPEAMTGVVTLLAELGDAPSYKTIMAAYREGKVNKEHAPAATVRQFLLGGGRRDLSCVNHPLFERYDHHGPHLRGPDDELPDDLP
jgi:hypothetical protein